MTTILLLLTACLPEYVVHDRVDVIEVNTVYSETGGKVFTQYIFWEWDRWDERHHVVDWTMAKGRPLSGRTLIYDDNRLRRIDAPIVRETHTQNDREVDERTIRPPCQRRGLTK